MPKLEALIKGLNAAFSTKMLKPETPGKALASIEPVSVAVVTGGGEGPNPARQARENELPSSVVASKRSCSVITDGAFPLGGKDAVQMYATAKLVSFLGIVMVIVPDMIVAGVKGAEPILMATEVGVTPVMVNLTTVGGPRPKFHRCWRRRSRRSTRQQGKPQKKKQFPACAPSTYFSLVATW